MSRLIGTKIFGSGGGCKACGRVSTNPTDGALVVSGSVPIPSAVGPTPTIRYSYWSKATDVGAFGPKRFKMGITALGLTYHEHDKIPAYYVYTTDSAGITSSRPLKNALDAHGIIALVS